MGKHFVSLKNPLFWEKSPLKSGDNVGKTLYMCGVTPHNIFSFKKYTHKHMQFSLRENKERH